MKKYITLTLLFFSTTIIAQNIKLQENILPSGTNIEIFLTHDISSKELNAGDIVRFSVKNAITAKNKTIIAQNTPVEALIVKSQKARSGGKQGKIDMMIENVSTMNDQKIPVYLTFDQAGEDKHTESFMIGMFLFWPAIFMNGGEAMAKAGSIATIQTIQDVIINFNGLPKVRQKDQKNLLYETIIKNSINPCGEKPDKPPTYNDPQYKQYAPYKKYKRALIKWEKCMKNR